MKGYLNNGTAYQKFDWVVSHADWILLQQSWYQ